MEISCKKQLVGLLRWFWCVPFCTSHLTDHLFNYHMRLQNLNHLKFSAKTLSKHLHLLNLWLFLVPRRRFTTQPPKPSTSKLPTSKTSSAAMPLTSKDGTASKGGAGTGITAIIFKDTRTHHRNSGGWSGWVTVNWVNWVPKKPSHSGSNDHVLGAKKNRGRLRKLQKTNPESF